METEKQVEAYLRQEIQKIGGEAYKFVSPGRRFVPDRICVCPRGVLVFVEVKGNGLEPTPPQMRELQRLQAKGHEACWVNSKERVDELINVIKEEIDERLRYSNGLTENKQS